jgi:hypothetical protein
MLHPSLSLLKPDPKFEASKITDEQIYAGLDTDRDKAVAEAEAVIKDMVKTQQETKDEEAADAAADAEAEKSFGRRSLSLLDPSFEANLMTDEEIYESVREFKPEEAGYWAKQEADWLDKPMQLSNETKYVRKWREVTIEGVGDQGDRHEWVEDSHWTINGPSVLALVEYLTGEKPTPFERQLAAGQINAPEGFRPVAIGDRLGYYVEYGGSGDRNHVIYNRDGSEYSHTHSEVPLVDEGIGPLTLALPGIGLPSMLRGGAALARGGLSAGRTAVGWAGRALQPFARRAAFTGRLLIGRAEAGAGIAAPTALGGVTSADITIVEGRALGGQVSNVARALPAAGETTASVSAVKPPTALPTVAPDPGVVEAGAGATTTAAPSPFPWQAGAPWYRVNPGDAWRQADIGAGDVFASGYGGESAGEAATPAITAGGATTQAPGEDTQGIPEAISETDSGAVTAPINTGAAVERADMERIGEYEVIGPTRVENGVMYHETRGLYRPAGRTTSIRPILQLFRLMIAQARAQGAHELRITGQLIANKNVLKIQRLAEYFGGTARRIDANTNEIVLPVPEE